MSTETELVSTVRLFGTRWVGECPVCGDRKVPMAKHDSELGHHKADGRKCPGVGRSAVNQDEAEELTLDAFHKSIDPYDPDRDKPRVPLELTWYIERPYRYSTVVRGVRWYLELVSGPEVERAHWVAFRHGQMPNFRRRYEVGAVEAVCARFAQDMA